jgi:uncharacterized protein YhfF
MDVAQSSKPFAAVCPGALPTSRRDLEVSSWELADDRDLVASRLERVLAGHQRAVARLLWTIEARGEQLPHAPDLRLVRDAEHRPAAVIEIIESQLLPFDQVDEHFAIDGGEGDLSLEHWRRTHWRRFERQCRELGRTPSPDMPVACVRFEVVWPAATRRPT